MLINKEHHILQQQKKKLKMLSFTAIFENSNEYFHALFYSRILNRYRSCSLILTTNISTKISLSFLRFQSQHQKLGPKSFSHPFKDCCEGFSVFRMTATILDQLFSAYAKFSEKLTFLTH